MTEVTLDELKFLQRTNLVYGVQSVISLRIVCVNQRDYLSVECSFSVDCIVLRLLRQYQEFSWLCLCLLELLQETGVPFQLISSPCLWSFERRLHHRRLLVVVFFVSCRQSLPLGAAPNQEHYYFNCGFTENWRKYCDRQQRIRSQTGGCELKD